MDPAGDEIFRDGMADFHVVYYSHGIKRGVFANSRNVFDSTSGTATVVGNVGELASAAIPPAEALAFMIAVTFMMKRVEFLTFLCYNYYGFNC